MRPRRVPARATRLSAKRGTSPQEHGCPAYSHRRRNPRGSRLGGGTFGQFGRTHSTGESSASTRRARAATSSRHQSTSTLPADSGISNPNSEFSSCDPYSRVHPTFAVGSWQRFAADQGSAPGSRRSEFRRVSVAQQNSQSICHCEYGSVGSQPQIASAARRVRELARSIWRQTRPR